MKLRPYLYGGAILAVMGAALHASHYLSQQTAVVSLVESIGYLAVFGLAIISGLNPVVPIPAATLTPVFLAADLTVIGIILALAVGTTIADALAYVIGHVVRTALPTDTARHRFIARAQLFLDAHPQLLLPVVFFYAAFVPFPNEALLIPLAAAGVSWRILIMPFMLGTTLHQTLLVNGVTLLGLG